MYLYCGIMVSIRNEVSEMAEKNTDRRTLKTQKALRDAMADLLAEKELRKITVQEIADKADVNRVTFYKHFLDVYDLYDKIEEDTLVELGLLVLRLEELPAEKVFSHFMEYISENRKLFRMIFSPNTTGQLRSKLGKLIEGLLLQINSEKLGKDITDKELSYISCYRAQGCLAVIAKWVTGGFEEPQELIIKTVSSLDSSTEMLFESQKGKKR